MPVPLHPASPLSLSASCYFLPRYAFVIVFAVVTLSLYSTLASPGRDRLGRTVRRTLVNWPKSSTLFAFLSVCLVPGCFLVPARRERALFPLAAHLLTHTHTHTLARLPAPAVLCVCPLTVIAFRASLVFFSSFRSNFSSLLHNKHYITTASDHYKQLKYLIRKFLRTTGVTA